MVMNIRVLTPDRVICSTTADEVVLPGPHLRRPLTICAILKPVAQNNRLPAATRLKSVVRIRPAWCW